MPGRRHAFPWRHGRPAYDFHNFHSPITGREERLVGPNGRNGEGVVNVTSHEEFSTTRTGQENPKKWKKLLELATRGCPALKLEKILS